MCAGGTYASRNCRKAPAHHSVGVGFPERVRGTALGIDAGDVRLVDGRRAPVVIDNQRLVLMAVCDVGFRGMDDERLVAGDERRGIAGAGQPRLFQRHDFSRGGVAETDAQGGVHRRFFPNHSRIHQRDGNRAGAGGCITC